MLDPKWNMPQLFGPHTLKHLRIYRIAENVGGRKHWRIWRIDGQSPKFSPSNLRNIQYPIFIVVHVILVG